MTNIEELKKKQPEYKESLQEVIDFINSEHYFNLTSSEKNLVSQYRMGLEMAVNALSNLTYGDMFTFDTGTNMILPFLLSGMTSGFGTSAGAEYLKKKLEEDDAHQELTDPAV